MQDAFEAQDQRDGNRRPLAESQRCDGRPHITDVAIGPGETLDRRLWNASAPDQPE